MTTEALPSERSVVLVETLKALHEQLESLTQVDDGTFNAIAMLLVDATLSGDDETLYEGERKLKNIYHLHSHNWISAEDAQLFGRLLGFIDVVTWARRRIIPATLLAELTAVSLPRQLLVILSLRQGKSTTSLELTRHVQKPGVGPDQTRDAMRLLGESHLVTTRLLGNTTYWEITARGRHALKLTRP